VGRFGLNWYDILSNLEETTDSNLMKLLEKMTNGTVTIRTPSNVVVKKRCEMDVSVSVICPRQACPAIPGHS